MSKYHYFILYKPYGVLSQFTREHPGHRVLGDLYDFPRDVYAVGRLDKDSEGLLLLTNDKTLNQRLLAPQQGHQRTYWAQVEGDIDENALQQLRQGVDIRIKKKDYHTRPAKARRLSAAPDLPERDPPIRYRKNVPESWLELQLTEGKNRQVRRMCAAVGFPVLRLVRVAIGQLTLGGLKTGEVKALPRKLVFQQLGLVL
ncbi:MAG: pseudouridine synthase [Bacteroidetes bacterium]|jgi:23S rRNA pseudouridine2457 synthase|nr:pseudouridine synthase [Bacteroidota bacterium]